MVPGTEFPVSSNPGVASWLGLKWSRVGLLSVGISVSKKTWVSMVKISFCLVHMGWAGGIGDCRPYFVPHIGRDFRLRQCFGATGRRASCGMRIGNRRPAPATESREATEAARPQANGHSRKSRRVGTQTTRRRRRREKRYRSGSDTKGTILPSLPSSFPSGR
jgi:hypothetical protein